MRSEYQNGSEKADCLNEDHQEYQSDNPTSQEEDPHAWRSHTCVYCGIRSRVIVGEGGSKIDTQKLRREISRTKKLVQSILENKADHVISEGGGNDSRTTSGSRKGKGKEVEESPSNKAPHLVPVTGEVEPADYRNILQELQESERKLQKAETGREELKDILAKTKGGMRFKETFQDLQTQKHALQEKITKLEYQLRGQRLEIKSLKRRLVAEDQANKEWKYNAEIPNLGQDGDNVVEGDGAKKDMPADMTGTGDSVANPGERTHDKIFKKPLQPEVHQTLIPSISKTMEPNLKGIRAFTNGKGQKLDRIDRQGQWKPCTIIAR
ncbi:hypothetical protein N7493_001728 [Penicillium malachiteum]|uniref:Uncharacterized protein n=1 Tax=Penicillium malachiteum TaxID=1324776 RepID=A0AAD6N083_9EURO|nr:hypothetical protein N7493_001728 [Penicillium malachiteum]